MEGFCYQDFPPVCLIPGSMVAPLGGRHDLIHIVDFIVIRGDEVNTAEAGMHCRYCIGFPGASADPVDGAAGGRRR